MSRNRYRNSIGLPVIVAVLIVCAALLLVSLSVVVNKNRLTALAEKQRLVDQQMKLLDLEIANLERKIDQHLDGARILPLLEAKGTLLQKINPDANVIIHLKSTATVKTVAQMEVSRQP